MKEDENLYDKIEELFGKNPGNFNILEEKIDVDTQIEYFEFSRKVASEFDDSWALDQIEYLKKESYPLEMKKKVLARLATVENVESYRAIESYLVDPDIELRDWAYLSLYESRMQLERDILGENQIFISTGLGGSKNKLRYFVVLIARNKQNLNATQKHIIRGEFEYTLRKFDAELEEIQFSDYLATILLLLPIQYPIKQVFQEAISECNEFGFFLNDNFIVTNVKLLSFGEIKDFIEKKEGE